MYNPESRRLDRRPMWKEVRRYVERAAGTIDIMVKKIESDPPSTRSMGWFELERLRTRVLMHPRAGTASDWETVLDYLTPVKYEILELMEDATQT